MGAMLSSEVEQIQSNETSQPGRGFAVAAGILGWSLDSFDFFVVVFMVDALAAHFLVDKKDIILTIGATLAMRPIGALISWRLWRDRFGRRKPLMAVVAFFSVVEVLEWNGFQLPHVSAV